MLSLAGTLAADVDTTDGCGDCLAADGWDIARWLDIIWMCKYNILRVICCYVCCETSRQLMVSACCAGRHEAEWSSTWWCRSASVGEGRRSWVHSSSSRGLLLFISSVIIWYLSHICLSIVCMSVSSQTNVNSYTNICSQLLDPLGVRVHACGIDWLIHSFIHSMIDWLSLAALLYPVYTMKLAWRAGSTSWLDELASSCKHYVKLASWASYMNHSWSIHEAGFIVKRLSSQLVEPARQASSSS